MTSPEWTSEIVALMHTHRIKQTELAKHLGIRREYLSLILNGIRNPKGIEQKIRNAVAELIEGK